MKVTVLDRQSIFDMAVQSSGSAEAAFEVAILNNLSITDDLEAGQELILLQIVNKEIATYYANRQLKPATGITESEIQPGGIDFMGIEIDFIIR